MAYFGWSSGGGGRGDKKGIGIWLHGSIQGAWWGHAWPTDAWHAHYGSLPPYFTRTKEIKETCQWLEDPVPCLWICAQLGQLISSETLEGQ